MFHGIMLTLLLSGNFTGNFAPEMLAWHPTRQQLEIAIVNERGVIVDYRLITPDDYGTPE